MHKHKEKSKSEAAWSAWSEWVWDGTRSSYYRVRQDANGNLDYEWNMPQTTPRDVEQLTDDFRKLSPGYLSYDTQGTGEYTVSSGSKDRRAGKSKFKGKHRTHDDSVGDDVATCHPYDELASYSQQPYAYDAQQYSYFQPPEEYYSQLSQGSRAVDSYAHDSPAYYVPSEVHSNEEDEEERMRETMAARVVGLYDVHDGSGESSTSAHVKHYDDYEGPPTPKAHLSAEGEFYEVLDPRYRLEHSSRFQPGEIFKVHWSEPQGSGNEHAPSVSDKQEIQNRFGTKFFVGFRRFVVVANDHGHSTCVPVLTYGGKGCKKKGVKPAKHGIIHERGHKARLLDGEPKLGFPPVRVEITEEGEALTKDSRVNYSKLVTVEHNVKVFFIGAVIQSDFENVQAAVNRCWMEKSHYKRRSR
ncbi:hypothetical protein RJ55_04542 [Drechmeria coniospora]|nr:hypothetical protein RJ55_04542 [Drechmeria coniospora]